MRLSFIHLPKAWLLLVFLLNTIRSSYVTDIQALTTIISESFEGADESVPAFYQNLEPFVAGRTFFGQWLSINGEPPNSFGHHTGFTHLRFSAMSKHLNNMTYKDHFALRFFDGEHIDNDFIMIVLPRKRPTPIIDQQNMTITSINMSALVFQSRKGFLECPSDLSLLFKDTHTGKPLDIENSNPESDNVGIQIILDSLDCGIRVETTVLTLYDPIIMNQITSYGFMMLFSGVINALAYVFLYCGIRRNTSVIFDISLPTLNFFTVFDIFIVLDHFHSSVYYQVNPVKILLQGIGALYIVSVIPLSLVFLLKIKRQIAELPWQEVSKKITEVRIGSFPFAMVSLLMAILGVLVGIREEFYLTLSLFLLPQIVQNAYINRKFRWNSWYIGAMFLPKILYFYYMEGYNYNLFRRTPHTTLCNSILVVIGIQMIILAIQTKYPRFVPRGPTPYKTIDLSHCVAQNCPICLQDFDKDQSIDIIKPADGRQHIEHQIVVTSCNHEFHMKCLKDWFTCKFECPYCRNGLPFSLEFEDQHQMV